MSANYDIRDRCAVTAAFAKYIADAVVKQLNTEMPAPLRNCINCMNFDEANELCKLNGMRPPAKIIATACNAHADAIPF